MEDELFLVDPVRDTNLFAGVVVVAVSDGIHNGFRGGQFDVPHVFRLKSGGVKFDRDLI